MYLDNTFLSIADADLAPPFARQQAIVSASMDPNSLNEKLFISFSGPIGSGKSTALETIAKYFPGGLESWCRIDEPLDEVLPYLEQAYKSPEKAKEYNLRTQLMFFNVRVKATRNAGKTSATRKFLAERTMFDDIIFWQNQKNLNLLKDGDDEIYRAFWRNWVELLEMDNMLPDLFVYFRPDDNECWRRIKERNRDCERTMTKDYTIALNAEHDRMYDTPHGVVNLPGGKSIPVLILRTNVNFRDDAQEASRIAELIMQTVKTRVHRNWSYL